MVTLSKFEDLLKAIPTVKNLYFKSKIFGGKSPCIKNKFVPYNSDNDF